MLGIDLVLPDTTYLVKNKERVKGIVVTHGHEDHIGALPYVLRDLNVPVYGTRLALGLLEYKLEEHGILSNCKLQTVSQGQTIDLGVFKVEFIRSTHSIADAIALAIHTPVGVVVHTSDFKVDYTPIAGEAIDLPRFAELGKKGVLLLMCDSTNVERPGYTMSERTVGEAFEEIFVNEGDFVSKGQVLARLESKEMNAKVEQAKGQLEAAKFKYKMALNGARPEEKEATEKLYLQAKHQFELAEKTYERMMNLYRDSLISAQEKDVYEFQYKAAFEQMSAAKSKYDMVVKGARYEEIEMAKGLYYQAENGYKEALAYQQELEIKSPIDGELQKKLVNQGEIISSGYPVFSIIDSNDYWVTIQLKEDEMNGIKIGDEFDGIIKALAGRNVKFKVDYISPIGDFANWRPTNQKGEFDIRTFEIRLKPTDRIEGLRPGMTVNIILNK
ncbi:MAG: efflux RND transporter periplasmic adaptor subunit, partial [Ignavibacterium sp.]|nr:efflux RND transporter periplasmic adaptor subunit [Ignavibacterium sp.]